MSENKCGNIILRSSSAVVKSTHSKQHARGSVDSSQHRLPTEAEREVKKLHVTLREKDKLLRALELELSQKDHRIEELTEQEVRHKNMEREYKRSLSSKSSNNRRMSVLLKQTQSSVDKIAQKEEAKLRRKQMEHKVLLEEFEKHEEAAERTIEDLQKSLTQEQEGRSADAARLTKEMEDALAEMNVEVNSLRSEKSDLLGQLDSLTSSHSRLETDLSVVSQEKEELVTALRLAEDRLNDLRDSKLSEINEMAQSYNAQLEALRSELIAQEEVHSTTTSDMQRKLDSAYQDIKDAKLTAERKAAEVLDEMALLNEGWDTELSRQHEEFELAKKSLSGLLSVANDDKASLEAKVKLFEENEATTSLKMADLRAQLCEKEGLLGAMQIESTTLQENLQNVRNDLQSLRCDLVTKQAECDGLQQQLTTSEDTAKTLNATLTTLESDKSQLESKLERATTDLQSLRCDLVTKQAECDGLQQQLTASEDTAKNLQDNLTTVETKKMQFETECAVLEETKVDLNRTISDFTCCLSSKENELSELRILYESSQKDNSALQEDITAKNESLVSLQDTLSTRSESLEKKIEELSELSNKVSRANEQVSDLEKKYSMLLQVNSKLTARLQLSESQVEDLIAREANATSLLQANEMKYVKRSVASAALRNQLDAAEDRISVYSKEMKDLEETNRSLTEQIADLESSIDTISTREASTKEWLNKALKEMSEVKSNFHQLENELVRLTHELEAARSKISDVFTDKSELGNKLSDALDKISSLGNDINLANTELASAQLALAQSKAKVQEKDNELKELQKQLKDTEDNLSATQSENYRHLKGSMELKEIVTALKVQISDLTESKQKLLQDMDKKGNEVKKAEVDYFRSLLEAKTAELDAIQRELQTLQVKYSRILVEHNEMAGHSNKKQKIQYITTLKQQINELVEENTRLRGGHH